MPARINRVRPVLVQDDQLQFRARQNFAQAVQQPFANKIIADIGVNGGMTDSGLKEVISKIEKEWKSKSNAIDNDLLNRFTKEAQKNPDKARKAADALRDSM